MKLSITRRRLMKWLGVAPAISVAAVPALAASPSWRPDDWDERHAAAREYVAAYWEALPRLRLANAEFHQANRNPHDFYSPEWADAQKALDHKLEALKIATLPQTDLCRRHCEEIAVCAVSGAPIWGNGWDEYLTDWYSGEYILRQAVGLPLSRPKTLPGMDEFFSGVLMKA